jgi:hypothetical protein
VKVMSHAEEDKRVAALLEKYPYDPEINPAVYEVGSPERLRGCPDGMRESLARIYVRSHGRWSREAELALRERLGKPAVHVVDESERRFP